VTFVLPAAFGAVFGLIIGSFLATLVIRWPQAQGISGRSQCDNCHIQLTPTQLVPLFSYLVQRGECAACHDCIDRRHPLIEALSGAIGAVAMIVSPDANGLAGGVFGWLLLSLAVLDVQHFWLPDRLTGALAAIGLFIALLSAQFADYLIGGALGYLTLWLIGAVYRRVRGRDGLGGGDAKLLGGIGLWLGWQALPFVLLAASLIGLAAVFTMRLMGRNVNRATPIPFGTMLALAAFPAWIVLQP
jgi:leader peptidase (prepilin peptidase) / N-methyltransferase